MTHLPAVAEVVAEFTVEEDFMVAVVIGAVLFMPDASTAVAATAWPEDAQSQVGPAIRGAQSLAYRVVR